ncbi:uncharacterized protein SPPG_07761 [Spizellomyces punctatus DAOM BR117]|uniref:Uncharacterized protein n=1 Tax=Spizellomyces punctatus (strain DAOM BR117) TaxID=645134 RepID=A0A0L0H8C2_SPIPD|nr:uncharacterized protein SPPG_07761 [Spizellomyces punctatus DAOM BR117]KNC96938.1 hypothetical protein SPPG_07761 [Spizellomyces punctatus DAOM BR117]|eukprot:XP_016604978.1 hypothetical protein SPPG_07761 [Spizellomyces punctatus DAOM BR117]
MTTKDCTSTTCEDPREWDKVAVGEWVRSLGLNDLVGSFLDNDIDGTVLLNEISSENVLREELNITSFGKRRKIWRGIQGLRKMLGIDYSFSASSSPTASLVTQQSGANTPPGSVPAAFSIDTPMFPLLLPTYSIADASSFPLPNTAEGSLGSQESIKQEFSRSYSTSEVPGDLPSTRSEQPISGPKTDMGIASARSEKYCNSQSTDKSICPRYDDAMDIAALFFDRSARKVSQEVHDDNDDFVFIRKRATRPPFSLCQTIAQSAIKRMLRQPNLTYDEPQYRETSPDGSVIAIWRPPLKTANHWVRLFKTMNGEVKDVVDNSGRYAKPETDYVEDAEPSHMTIGNSKAPVLIKGHGFAPRVPGGYACKRQRLEKEDDDEVLPLYGDSETDDYENDSEWEEECQEDERAEIRRKGNSATFQAEARSISDPNASSLREQMVTMEMEVNEEEAEEEKQGEHDLDHFARNGKRRGMRKWPPSSQIGSGRRDMKTHLPIVVGSTRFLSSEKIQSIIDEEVKGFENRWRTRELPKLEKKAYKLWKNERFLLEDKKLALEDLQTRRFAKQLDGYLSHKCSSVREIRAKCANLEATVEEMCSLKWMIELFEGEKPIKPVSEKVGAPRRKRDKSAAFAKEDDHWSDFIASEDEYGETGMEVEGTSSDEERIDRETSSTHIDQPRSPVRWSKRKSDDQPTSPEADVNGGTGTNALYEEPSDQETNEEEFEMSLIPESEPLDWELNALPESQPVVKLTALPSLGNRSRIKTPNARPSASMDVAVENREASLEESDEDVLITGFTFPVQQGQPSSRSVKGEQHGSASESKFSDVASTGSVGRNGAGTEGQKYRDPILIESDDDNRGDLQSEKGTSAGRRPSLVLADLRAAQKAFSEDQKEKIAGGQQGNIRNNVNSTSGLPTSGAKSKREAKWKDRETAGRSRHKENEFQRKIDKHFLSRWANEPVDEVYARVKNIRNKSLLGEIPTSSNAHYDLQLITEHIVFLSQIRSNRQLAHSDQRPVWDARAEMLDMWPDDAAAKEGINQFITWRLENVEENEGSISDQSLTGAESSRESSDLSGGESHSGQLESSLKKQRLFIAEDDDNNSSTGILSSKSSEGDVGRERISINGVKRKIYRPSIPNRKKSKSSNRRVPSDDSSSDTEVVYIDSDSASDGATGSRRQKGRREIKEIRPMNDLTRRIQKQRGEQEEAIRRRAKIQSSRLSLTERKIIVNLGHDESEEDILVPDFIAGELKDHQIEGIRFLWKNIVMLKQPSADGQSMRHAGCILAHAMGLGKTIQTIVFIFVLMREIRADSKAIPEHLRAGRVLIVVPASVVTNWLREFFQWIPESVMQDVLRNVETLTSMGKTMLQRRKTIEKWHSEGGVLITGYNMLQEQWKQSKKASDELMAMQQHEMSQGGDPTRIQATTSKYENVKGWIFEGTSLLVCDEGHLIKNTKSLRCQLMNNFQTPSRICLTGFPLQNNLSEYWCMIDFAVSMFLGTHAEFRNNYENPIANGLHADSTDSDRILSRRRMYMLTRLIHDIVLRKDNAPLRRELPEKTEFVIVCKLTTLQHEAYRAYLQTVEPGCSFSNIIARMHPLLLLCGHPGVFKRVVDEKFAKLEKLGKSISRGKAASSSRRESFASEAQPDTDFAPTSITAATSIADVDPELDGDAEDVIQEDNVDVGLLRTLHPTFDHIFSKYQDILSLEHSIKMQITMQIVHSARRNKQKVLIFSRSVPTLHYIKDAIDKEGIKTFLIKGDVQATDRQKLIDEFNKSSIATVFVISTQAGSVGVNLQGATRVVLFDIGWNPSDAEQAVARAYRYGQREPVFVYRLQTCDTFETTLYKNNIHKLGLSKQVVDKKNTSKNYTKAEMKKYFEPPPKDRGWEVAPEEEESLRNKNDPVLNDILTVCREGLIRVREHEDLLQEIEDEMDEAERAEGERALEEERIRRKEGRRGGPPPPPPPPSSPPQTQSTSTIAGPTPLPAPGGQAISTDQPSQGTATPFVPGRSAHVSEETIPIPRTAGSTSSTTVESLTSQPQIVDSNLSALARWTEYKKHQEHLAQLTTFAGIQERPPVFVSMFSARPSTTASVPPAPAMTAAPLHSPGVGTVGTSSTSAPMQSPHPMHAPASFSQPTYRYPATPAGAHFPPPSPYGQPRPPSYPADFSQWTSPDFWLRQFARPQG